jgi:hypothetical protein
VGACVQGGGGCGCLRLHGGDHAFMRGWEQLPCWDKPHMHCLWARGEASTDRTAGETSAPLPPPCSVRAAACRWTCLRTCSAWTMPSTCSATRVSPCMGVAPGPAVTGSQACAACSALGRPDCFSPPPPKQCLHGCRRLSKNPVPTMRLRQGDAHPGPRHQQHPGRDAGGVVQCWTAAAGCGGCVHLHGAAPAALDRGYRLRDGWAGGSGLHRVHARPLTDTRARVVWQAGAAHVCARALAPLLPHTGPHLYPPPLHTYTSHTLHAVLCYIPITFLITEYRGAVRKKMNKLVRGPVTVGVGELGRLVGRGRRTAVVPPSGAPLQSTPRGHAGQ